MSYEQALDGFALVLGFAAMGALMGIALLGGYLAIYELIRAAGRRVFLPIWVWNLVLVCTAIRSSWPRKDCTKHTIARYLEHTLLPATEKHPEFRDGLIEFARDVVRLYDTGKGGAS